MYILLIVVQGVISHVKSVVKLTFQFHTNNYNDALKWKCRCNALTTRTTQMGGYLIKWLEQI